MLDFVSRPNDVYTFISQDGTTLVPPFSCTYNNGEFGGNNQRTKCKRYLQPHSDYCFLLIIFRECGLVANEARNLAVGDEDGTIHIVDTARDGAHPGTNIWLTEISADDDNKEADHEL